MNSLFGFIVVFIVGVLFGIVVSGIAFAGTRLHSKINVQNEEEVDKDGYTQEEKTSCWRIVRYKDGKFDCVWSGNIYDKRVADMKCDRLNDRTGEGNEWRYGTYVVEK